MRGCIPLTTEQINQVKDTLGPIGTRDRTAFVVGYRTGLRAKSLVALRVCDVFDGVKVRDIIQVLTRNSKGKRPSQTIALHREAKEELAAYLSARAVQCRPEAPLFASRKGVNQPITTKQLWRILSDAFDRAGIVGLERQLGTHTMRKTFAERVYQVFDRDLVKLKQALNHANINSTAQYLSFTDEEIQNGIRNAK